MSGTFGPLPPEEIERRRALSLVRLREIERSEWEAKYQEICDRLYWKHGKCCAGCDHWSSHAGLTGECTAAGIMSGAEVMRSMGFTFCSHMPEPGFPHTRGKHVCGMFKDDFDWSALSDDYLQSIGAMRGGKLRSKP